MSKGGCSFNETNINLPDAEVDDDDRLVNRSVVFDKQREGELMDREAYIDSVRQILEHQTELRKKQREEVVMKLVNECKLSEQAAEIILREL